MTSIFETQYKASNCSARASEGVNPHCKLPIRNSMWQPPIDVSSAALYLGCTLLSVQPRTQPLHAWRPLEFEAVGVVSKNITILQASLRSSYVLIRLPNAQTYTSLNAHMRMALFHHTPFCVYPSLNIGRAALHQALNLEETYKPDSKTFVLFLTCFQ